MGARRRAGPAAIAAALIGVGLLLHRPRLVPELSAGPRAGPRPAPALAAAIAWPRPTAHPATAPAGAPAAGHEQRDEDISAWRDALADRPFLTLDHVAAAPRSAPGAMPAREETHRSAAPGSGEAARRMKAPARDGARSEREEAARSAAERKPLARATDAPPSRRELLAGGPAPLDEEEDEKEGSVSGVRTRTPSVGGSWRGRRARFFPLFHPPKRASARSPRSAASRRVRPLLLSRMIGRDALRPPPAALRPPDLSGLERRKPARLPDGAPVPSRPYELDRIEAHDPRRAPASDRTRAAHWDEGLRWHDGPAQGVAADARWLWLWRDRTRWWALRKQDEAPLLRHRELWWGKMRGVWFALHDGELWSWRRFSDWDAEGLIRLTDGVEIVYSSDFTKVAVITPGAGAVLYDAASGAELGERLESEMPRRRPRAPAGLRLPRGI